MNTDLDKRLSVHEAVCAERYLGIQSRLGRIEKLMIGGTGAVIAALATVLWQLAR